MVNEINHPKGVNGVNGQLNQRLAAPTRALQEMQLEHQQLLTEMEILRQRADELRRLRIIQEMAEQQQSQERDEKVQDEEEEDKRDNQQQQIQQIENCNKEQAMTLDHSILENQSTRMQQTIEKEEKLEKTVEEEEEEEEETKTVMEVINESLTEWNYIQEKLNEIARLKAHYKKVQNLINTTKKIEEHLTHKSITTNEIIEHSIKNNENNTELKRNSSAVTSNDEKRQLLNAMIDMFQDLSTDLREQVTNLQDERERIRILKDEIISKRQ